VIRALRGMRRDTSDRGMTLTELLVSMTIFGGLMAIVMGVMIQLMYLSRDSLSTAQSVEQARLGISQIDRQVRSGNLIANPSLETVSDSGVEPYFSLRIYTQENGVDRCVQWRVIDDNADNHFDLQFRSWDPNYPVVNDVTDWTMVAQNVVVPDAVDTSTPGGWPPFFVDSSMGGATDAHFVRITLRMKGPDARADAKPVTVTTVVMGRNTVFGYPTSSCTNVPDPD